MPAPADTKNERRLSITKPPRLFWTGEYKASPGGSSSRPAGHSRSYFFRYGLRAFGQAATQFDEARRLAEHRTDSVGNVALLDQPLTPAGEHDYRGFGRDRLDGRRHCPPIDMRHTEVRDDHRECLARFQRGEECVDALPAAVRRVCTSCPSSSSTSRREVSSTGSSSMSSIRVWSRDVFGGDRSLRVGRRRDLREKDAESWCLRRGRSRYRFRRHGAARCRRPWRARDRIPARPWW